MTKAIINLIFFNGLKNSTIIEFIKLCHKEQISKAYLHFLIDEIY